MFEGSLGAIFDPASSWPLLLGIALILAATVLSVSLISHSAQRAIRGMAFAARTALSAAPAGGGKETTLRTSGRGDVPWHEGGFRMDVSHRPTQGNTAEDSFALLRRNLAEAKIDSRDIEEIDSPAPGVSSVRICVREPGRIKDIAKATLASGYTENRSGHREEITPQDAHDDASNRAIQDALDNAESLCVALGLSRKDLGMTAVELSTEALPILDGDRIVKVATASWALKSA